MVEKWAEPLQKCCFIPQRYILAVMGFLAVINAYTMRNCIAVTITEMVSGHTTVVVTDTRDWDEVTQGIILGSFYYGYVITHLPGGILADRKGGKYVLSLGILSTAVLTLLTPIVVEYGDWIGLVVIRVLEGLLEGTTFPALSVLLAHWVPKKDRSKFACLVFTGSQIGTIVANVAAGYLIAATGTWSIVFYVFGLCGVLWFIAWQLLCFSTPSTHPYISDKERDYLLTDLDNFSKESAPIPWHGICGSMAVWALIIGQVGHDWIFFAMVSDLPKYMKVALNLTVSKNGLYSSFPYMVMWVSSMACGFIADKIIEKKCWTVATVRKVFTTLGAVLPATFVVLASYSGRDTVMVITYFTIAMGTMGPYYAGLKVNALDITTNYAGLVMAIENGGGATAGMVIPYIIGVIVSLKGDPIFLWRIVFWLTFAVCAGTSVVYVFYAQGEEQYWNQPDKYKEVRDKQKADKLETTQAKKTAKEEKARAKEAAKAERARQQNTA